MSTTIGLWFIDMSTVGRGARSFQFQLMQLGVGLVLFGVSLALLVKANLGLAPWDVLHQGLARSSGLTLGLAVIGTSVAVLMLWIPLRQRPGLGTVANAVVVGLVVDLTGPLIPQAEGVIRQTLMLGFGIALNGLATGMYIEAGLGPGPRDGLMTGLAARGRSIRQVRTSIELAVLLGGWLLGGTVGIATAVFALAIGPLTQFALRLFDRPRPVQTRPHRRKAHTMTSHRPQLLVVTASTRPGANGRQIARWVVEQLERRDDLRATLVDLADQALPLLDEPNHPRDQHYVHSHTIAWSETVAAAEGFVFVLPEYNRGMPATLKNALDYLYYEWRDKPVGFVSYSGGVSGGTRAVEMTKQVVTTLRMLPAAAMLNIPSIGRRFTDGSFTAPDDAAGQLEAMADELVRLGRASRALHASTC